MTQVPKSWEKMQKFLKDGKSCQKLTERLEMLAHLKILNKQKIEF